MGCCVSTKNKGNSASASKKQRKSVANHSSRAPPPPPPVEEEAVKEVLSETPTSKPPIRLIPPTCQLPKNLKPEKPIFERVSEPLGVTSQKPEKLIMKANHTAKRLKELKPKATEEISEEVSDICSLSESVSISTATNLTDDSALYYQGHIGDPRSPAKIQPSRARSSSGDMATRRDQTAQSQARRSDQSPRRKNVELVRPALSGEPGRSRSAPRRRERDLGETSARRSRSPAMTRVENPGPGGTRSGVGRSPSTRRMNPSPGRVRADPNEGSGRDLDGNSSGQGNLLSSGNKQPSGDELVDLENPLVSLECFIFL